MATEVFYAKVPELIAERDHYKALCGELRDALKRVMWNAEIRAHSTTCICLYCEDARAIIAKAKD